MSEGVKSFVGISAILAALLGVPIINDYRAKQKTVCSVVEGPDFSQINKSDPSKYTSYNEITQSGVRGQTEECEKNNTLVSNRIVQEPVNQITVKGTKPAVEFVPTFQRAPIAAGCPITTCNDSTCSSSTGRGTCSHHGGVRY